MDTKTYLGVEIGGSKPQLVLGDEKAEILERFRFVVDRTAGAEKIRQHIAETLHKLKPEKLSAIGVGYGGPIDRVTGSGSYAIPSVGIYNQTFVSDMLANMMNVHATILTALPFGVSDVRLYRVMLLNGAKGLDIEAGTNLDLKAKK